MQLSEKEIEDIIFNDLKNNNSKSLINKGFILEYYERLLDDDYFKDVNPKIKWFRQLGLGAYGIVDIVGFYKYCGYIRVELIELKARQIESDDFEQIIRYEYGLYRYLQNTFNTHCINIKKTLVGTEYRTGHFIQNNTDTDVAILRYGIDGLEFKHHKETTWERGKDEDCTFRNKIYKIPVKLPLSTPSVKLKNGFTGNSN